MGGPKQRPISGNHLEHLGSRRQTLEHKRPRQLVTRNTELRQLTDALLTMLRPLTLTLGMREPLRGLKQGVTLAFKVVGCRFELMRDIIWSFLIAIFNSLSFLMFYGIWIMSALILPLFLTQKLDVPFSFRAFLPMRTCLWENTAFAYNVTSWCRRVLSSCVAGRGRGSLVVVMPS